MKEKVTGTDVAGVIPVMSSQEIPRIFEIDLLVIGGWLAGLAAAREAAGRGLRAAPADRGDAAGGVAQLLHVIR